MAKLGKSHVLRDRHYFFWLDRTDALIFISEWREAALTFSEGRLCCLPLIYKNQFLSRWVRISISRCRVTRRVKLPAFKDREFEAFS